MTHMMGMVIKKGFINIRKEKSNVDSPEFHEFPEREKVESIHLSLYGASIFLK